MIVDLESHLVSLCLTDPKPPHRFQLRVFFHLCKSSFGRGCWVRNLFCRKRSQTVVSISEGLRHPGWECDRWGELGTGTGYRVRVVDSGGRLGHCRSPQVVSGDEKQKGQTLWVHPSKDNNVAQMCYYVKFWSALGSVICGALCFDRLSMSGCGGAWGSRRARVEEPVLRHARHELARAEPSCRRVACGPLAAPVPRQTWPRFSDGLQAATRLCISGLRRTPATRPQDRDGSRAPQFPGCPGGSN